MGLTERNHVSESPRALATEFDFSQFQKVCVNILSSAVVVLGPHSIGLDKSLKFINFSLGD